jgi:PAS domain S-box-containing protein
MPKAAPGGRAAPLGLSVNRYRQLVEDSLGLICAHDLDGQFLFVNAAAARSLGYDAGAWMGRNLRDFIAPDARPFFDEYLKRIRETATDSGLLRVLDRAGREHVWMYHNIRAEEPGEPPYVLGHALDITARISAEQALRASRDALRDAYRELDARVQERTEELRAANDRLRTEMAERQRAQLRERETLTFLARASDELTREFDVDTTLASLARLPVPFLAEWTLLHVANDDGTVRAIGGRHLDPAGASLLAEIGALPACRPEPGSLVARALASAPPSHLEAEAATLACELLGTGPWTIPLASLASGPVLVVPLALEQRVIGTLTLSTRAGCRFDDSDLAVVEELLRRFRVALTQVRLYREAQEANRLKDEFLATLSHELRTPLNAVLGWARILRSRPLDDKAAHAVRVIERNAEAQARLIEDVLDVSRIITGKLTLEVEPIHLPVVVAAALDSIRPAANARGVRLAETIEPVPLVSGDAHRLQQVIWNLLSNAVKFTGAGGSVVVGLRRRADTVELTVSDTGVGIRREALPFVFDRFRQADPSTTRSQTGLGLGLAIVRHLVELHGGTVAVESVEGQGTTFAVCLPVQDAETDDVPSAPPGFREDRTPGLSDLPLQGFHVLVVDDHQDARELAHAVLQGAGAAVATADSAAGALRLFESVPVDALVADIGLPGQDGYALIRRVRALPADRGGEVVAVALTGYARPEDRTRALAAGFNGHIIKPAEPASLVRTLRALLSARPRSA